jgi:hypothetical protein
MANCNQPLADISELLREKQGEGKVAKQEDRHNERNDSDEINLHWRLPQLLTGLDVEKRQAKENHCEKQHRSILQQSLHYGSLSSFRSKVAGLVQASLSVTPSLSIDNGS